jgi:arsenate reductase
MYQELIKTIATFSIKNISEERKIKLQPLIDFIQLKLNVEKQVRLHFICTHNSRRSHLAQIWAKALAFHTGIIPVACFSGGTEVTALFPMVAETLQKQGFKIERNSEQENPYFLIKYDDNEMPVIGFSKEYRHFFNPTSHFIAIMTCNHADQGCPIVFGSEAKFLLNYEDPKIYDGTSWQEEKYAERSLEIGQEMWWIFSQLKG